eukprot:357141-Chlamydomonas_euryale.AAC.2
MPQTMCQGSETCAACLGLRVAHERPCAHERHACMLTRAPMRTRAPCVHAHTRMSAYGGAVVACGPQCTHGCMHAICTPRSCRAAMRLPVHEAPRGHVAMQPCGRPCGRAAIRLPVHEAPRGHVAMQPCGQP